MPDDQRCEAMNRREMLETSLATIPAAVGLEAVAASALPVEDPPTVTRRFLVRDPWCVNNIVGCLTRYGGRLLLVADCHGSWNHSLSAWDVEVTLRRTTHIAMYREIELEKELVA